MDPTRNICAIRDSFNSNGNEKKYENPQKYQETISSTIQSPRTRRHKLLSETNQQYKEVRINKGPFSFVPEEIADLNIKSEVFNRSDLILSNIDAIYNFSGQEDGYLKPQIFKDFDYVNLGRSYITYLQYRLPFARGFLHCDDSSVLGKYIDSRNLNISCDNLVDYVLNIIPEGVDLVVSDKINYKNNLISALKVCKPGGTFICKIDESIVELSLKYITAACFETFSLFKPISENLNNNYSYIIGQNYKGNSIDWIPMLDKQITIPASFLSFVEKYYDSLNNLRKDLMQNPIRYDSYKCKAIWNVF